jgi:hypothetical protein
MATATQQSRGRDCGAVLGPDGESVAHFRPYATALAPHDSDVERWVDEGGSFSAAGESNDQRNADRAPRRAPISGLVS